MPRLIYVDFDGVLHPTVWGDLFCKLHLLGLFSDPLRGGSPYLQETLSWADGPA